MEIIQNLRELAKFSAGGVPVISIYLDAQWRDQHQRERVSTFLARHLRQAQTLAIDSDTARQSLQSDLARIGQWGEHLLRRELELSTPGMALFACRAADLWLELPAPLAFEDEFVIADRPALRQLARLDEDYTNALVVLVDSRAARICEVVLGGFLSETAFASEVPGRHKQGGWAQMRYQRHVKNHMDQHHKEVADYLVSYLAARPQTSIILSGQEAIVSNFRYFLSPAVQRQILDECRLDIRESQTRILEAAQEILQRHEREEELETVQRLLNRAGRGILAVLGMQATVAAVNAGQVHLLVMHRDLRQEGWRCSDCNRLGEAMPPKCPACGGKVVTAELGEALVSRVLQTDGFVEQVAPDARLASYEGVGALLRYH